MNKKLKLTDFRCYAVLGTLYGEPEAKHLGSEKTKPNKLALCALKNGWIKQIFPLTCRGGLLD